MNKIFSYSIRSIRDNPTFISTIKLLPTISTIQYRIKYSTMLIIYNYFKGKLRENYLTKGSLDQFSREPVLM